MQYSLLDITDTPFDYSGKRVMIPLSEGINSAAVLCLLGEHHPEELKPERLYLFDVHLREHSPDSLQFAYDCIQYARTRFKWVTAEIVQDSMNDWAVKNKMIPHPSVSPCSRELKMKPMDAYFEKHSIDYRLIGYVRTEMRRWKNAQKHVNKSYQYPIMRLTDEDCFDLVERTIGWYPAIYKITRRGKRGQIERVFKHNNCLPCKNMTEAQMVDVGEYFPAYAEAAEEAAAQIPDAYWGRSDVPDVFKCNTCDRL